MSYNLLLAFDRDVDDFVYGFEAGRVWIELRKTDDAYDTMMHVENTEMIMRIAEALGRDVNAEECSEGWLHVHFSANKKDNDAVV